MNDTKKTRRKLGKNENKLSAKGNIHWKCRYKMENLQNISTLGFPVMASLKIYSFFL